MKNLLVAINAKYIHTNTAVRLLKANCSIDSTIIEFTIKDSIDFILDSILSKNPTTVTISTYIWNVEIVKELCLSIKNINKEIIIILGGPEVSFDVLHFFEYDVDFIISDEGEIAYNGLINAICNKTGYKDIKNVSYIEDGVVYSNKIEEIQDLDNIISPFYHDDDLSHIKNKIQYIETSRGCPYKCSYCMSSLSKHVRFFDIENVKKDILFLIENGARVFKFLDRTFNANKKYAIAIFDFIIKNHKSNNSFQFEITGDVLLPSIIDYLNEYAPKGLFRFEIGIQSTNVLTNELVDRIQNNDKLFSNIKRIQDGKKIDLHLDLIAGLPKEDLLSFENTFNEVIDLYPEELQLGFLKMLRGTKIRNEYSKYNYVFQKDSPYEIISNDVLSHDDILVIKKVEQALEKLWNSEHFKYTKENLLSKLENKFEFFLNFSNYYESKYSWFSYQLDEFFKRVHEFTKDIPFFFDYLKLDYLNFSKVKPKIWWDNPIDKKMKNNILREYFEIDKSIPIHELYKYSYVDKFKDKYIICVYHRDFKQIILLGDTNETERAYKL